MKKLSKTKFCNRNKYKDKSNIKIKFLCDKDGFEIITLSGKLKQKPKFINPNILHISNSNDEEQIDKIERKIRIYPSSEPYRISPLVNSNLQIYQITKDGKFFGFILDKIYPDETIPKDMKLMRSVPTYAKVAFDKLNNEIGLIGRDAIGCWTPMPKIFQNKPTRYTSTSNETMAEHTAKYKLRTKWIRK